MLKHSGYQNILKKGGEPAYFEVGSCSKHYRMTSHRKCKGTCPRDHFKTKNVSYFLYTSALFKINNFSISVVNFLQYDKQNGV